MLTINLVFILIKSVNYSVNLFSNRNMNSANVFSLVGYLPVIQLTQNDEQIQTNLTKNITTAKKSMQRKSPLL